MTPKEKAKELVEKMYGSTPVRNSKYLISQDKITAKQCALICVQQIILSNPQSNPFNNWHIKSTMDYWEEVRTEIEKL